MAAAKDTATRPVAVQHFDTPNELLRRPEMSVTGRLDLRLGAMCDSRATVGIIVPVGTMGRAASRTLAFSRYL